MSKGDIYHEKSYLDVLNRFWYNVDIKEDHECWIRKASLTGFGYTQLKIEGESVASHRFSWEIHNGNIPVIKGKNRLCVLHKCDNRACVNPHHLFLGTQKDNIQDMIKKGRRHNSPAKGSQVHGSKLTENQVRIIKRSLKLGIDQWILSKIFQISAGTICNIYKNKRWKHINI